MGEVTPGGNPACPLCGHWYGPGEPHQCPNVVDRLRKRCRGRNEGRTCSASGLPEGVWCTACVAVAALQDAERRASNAEATLAGLRDAVAVPCEECDGVGRTVQGWTDKNGYSEDQWGDCASCGGAGTIPPEKLTEDERVDLDTVFSPGNSTGLERFDAVERILAARLTALRSRLTHQDTEASITE